MKPNSSFSGCGGTSDPTNGRAPKEGIGSASGGTVRHAAAKSKANIKPPNAKSYASFRVNGKGKSR